MGDGAFELMGRLGVEFALKNIAGTRDPLAASHPWYVLAEFSSGEPGSAEASMERFLTSAGLEAGLIGDAVVAQTDAQAKALWAIRENQSPAQKPEGATWKHDVSVPVSRVAAFLVEADKACWCRAEAVGLLPRRPHGRRQHPATTPSRRRRVGRRTLPGVDQDFGSCTTSSASMGARSAPSTAWAR